MTDFERIRQYYKYFDEKNRLINTNSGKLEYVMTTDILEKNLPSEGTILDLGGGAGAYSFHLAEKGYKVYLADLSEELIMMAKKQVQESGNNNLISCDVVNATDLSVYHNNQFDAILLLGPLYHLLEKEEREKCVSEVRRVLKTGGIVFAGFIPYLSGSIAIVDRYFGHPNQVNTENLMRVFQYGQFRNLENVGFQEGYYPTSAEIEMLFRQNGFNKLLTRSVRGFGYEKEDMLELMRQRDPSMFDTVMKIINETAENSAIIEMCGHAIHVCQKE